jgi:hypothetical protein
MSAPAKANFCRDFLTHGKILMPARTCSTNMPQSCGGDILAQKILLFAPDDCSHQKKEEPSDMSLLLYHTPGRRKPKWLQ